jgi:hypothetical protein
LKFTEVTPSGTVQVSKLPALPNVTVQVEPLQLVEAASATGAVAVTATKEINGAINIQIKNCTKP